MGLKIWKRPIIRKKPSILNGLGYIGRLEKKGLNDGHTEDPPSDEGRSFDLGPPPRLPKKQAQGAKLNWFLIRTICIGLSAYLW